MFAKNSSESLDGTENGSVNDDWAFETWLKRHLSPCEFLGVVIIRLEHLRVKLLLFLRLVLEGFLFLSSSLTLILEVETNRLLEIDLNSTALVLSLKSIVDLHVDLGSVESTITRVQFPGSTEVVKSVLKSTFSLIPHVVSSKTVFRSG